MRALWLTGLATLLGCAAEGNDRDTANRQAGTATIGQHLKVVVQGGSILQAVDTDGAAPARVQIRAQSLDLRIDVSSDGCAPLTVVLEVSHLAEGTSTRWRPLLDAISPEAAAAREAAGGAVDFLGDPEDRDRTPLAAELPFETETVGGVAVWTAVLDRGRSLALLLPGEVDVPFGQPGACATLGAEGSGNLGQADLVVRHRLRRQVTGPFSFAVWGNNAGDRGLRSQVIDAVNQSDALFAIINGDLTAEGSIAQIQSATAQLDAELLVPWFATPGDRDVFNELGERVIETWGATSFAMDVGAVRLMVADSGDAAFTDRTHDLIDDWLADAPLWWPGRAAPPARLLITHVPPFDPYGTRSRGFKSRQDAARLVATLRRAGVPTLIASQFATFDRQDVAGLEVVHSGGAGAPIQSDSSAAHHWLEVQVGAQCSPPDAQGVVLGDACRQRRCRTAADGLTTCPCEGGLWCDEGVCAPCLQVISRPL
jgi:hypothetical protein